MPEFPDFETQPDFARPSLPASSPGAGGIVPEAIQQGAQEVGQTADEFAQNALNLQRETKNAAHFSSGLDKLQSDAAAWSRLPDHVAAHDGFIGDAKSIGAQEVEGETDPVVIARTQANLADAAARMAGTVQTAAFGEERNQQLASLQASSLDLGQQLVAAGQDAGLRAGITAQFQRSVSAAQDAHLIEPTEAETLTRQFTSRGVEVQVEQLRNQALATRDPAAMLSLAQKIDDGSSFPGLLPQDRERLGMRAISYANMLQGERARQEAKAERAQLAWLAVAQGQAHGAYQDDLASIAATGLPVSHDTGFAIRQAYPADKFPGVADEMVGNLQQAQQRYVLGQKLALASPDEEGQLVAQAAPAGKGFAQQEKTQQDLVAAIQAKHTALAQDPAGYVLQANPELGQAFQKAAQDPTQFPGAVAQLDAAYDRLGMAQGQRRVLPVAQANTLVSSIVAAPADQRAQTLESLAQQAGPAWPRVMGDLVKAKLPPEYNVLAALPDAASRTLFADAIGNGKEKIRAALPQADAKVVDAAIAEHPGLAQLRQSFATASGGGDVAQTVTEAAKLLGYRMALTGDPDTAASRAAAALTTDKYDFWSQGGTVARLPKGLSGPIESAAQATLDGLKPAQLAPIDTGTGVTLTDDQRRAVALDSVTRGSWVTNEGETGLVRLGADGRPIQLANGVRLEVPFPAPAPATGTAAGATLPPPTTGVPSKPVAAMQRDLEHAAGAVARTPVHPRRAPPLLPGANP